MNVLYWNVQRKQLDGLAVHMVQEHDVDLLMLVERAGDGHGLLRPLRGVGPFEQIPSHQRFAVYGRFESRCMVRVVPPMQNARADYWRLERDGHVDLNLALVHGLDVRNNSRGKRRLFFERVARNVSWLESDAGHRRTVVLGDFNANPFDGAVAGATGLHAIRVKEVHGRTHRRVLGEDHEFFYNPMWGCYRGSTDSPPASYYYYNYEEYELFWHMVDQLVLRPELLDRFPEDRLRILTRAGPVSLVTERGLPDETNASDHLPVLFRLNLER